MMTRARAGELIEAHLPAINLRRHSLAVAAVMESLAEKFGEDREKWFLAGILHDLDYETTRDDPARHGMETMTLLRDADLPDDLLHAIRAHAAHEPLLQPIDRALWAADPVTGLVTAAALMHPDRKVTSVEVKSLLKKYKTKGFAAGADRTQIASCESLGLTLEDFLALSLLAMGSYESDLGF
jgi:uncharacterized protein